jgi:mannose-6-phosphate isomerase-like protein (cupin superfamily)
MGVSMLQKKSGALLLVLLQAVFLSPTRANTSIKKTTGLYAYHKQQKVTLIKRGATMKFVLSLAVAGVFLLLTSATTLVGQDWKKANPKMNKVLIDTTLVRSIEVTIQPKEKSDVHSHPANFFYALTDGKLAVHYTDGKTETFELKAGECGFSEPERPHVTENVGNKPVKFLLVELKEHPYKSSK